MDTLNVLQVHLASTYILVILFLVPSLILVCMILPLNKFDVYLLYLLCESQRQIYAKYCLTISLWRANTFVMEHFIMIFISFFVNNSYVTWNYLLLTKQLVLFTADVLTNNTWCKRDEILMRLKFQEYDHTPCNAWKELLLPSLYHSIVDCTII